MDYIRYSHIVIHLVFQLSRNENRLSPQEKKTETAEYSQFCMHLHTVVLYIAALHSILYSDATFPYFQLTHSLRMHASIVFVWLCERVLVVNSVRAAWHECQSRHQIAHGIPANGSHTAEHTACGNANIGDRNSCACNVLRKLISIITHSMFAATTCLCASESVCMRNRASMYGERFRQHILPVRTSYGYITLPLFTWRRPIEHFRRNTQKYQHLISLQCMCYDKYSNPIIERADMASLALVIITCLALIQHNFPFWVVAYLPSASSTDEFELSGDYLRECGIHSQRDKKKIITYAYKHWLTSLIAGGKLCAVIKQKYVAYRMAARSAFHLIRTHIRMTELFLLFICSLLYRILSLFGQPLNVESTRVLSLL